MEKLNLSSPWVIFYREIEALFKYDNEIEVKFDEESMTIKLFADSSQKKIEALTRILPQEKTFANVTVKVEVVPANFEFENDAAILWAAFKGNPALGCIDTKSTVFGEMYFAMFKRDVVQFYVDAMNDPRGFRSTLFEDIARDVFEGTVNGVNFCTQSYEVYKLSTRWKVDEFKDLKETE